MSEQRDELARIIEREYTRAIDRRRPTDAYDAPADAILAAGYRKPRTITTVEDINAMPVGSIIRMADTKAPFLKTIEGWESTRIPGKPVHEYAHSSAYLPATVLYEPTP